MRRTGCATSLVAEPILIKVKVMTAKPKYNGAAKLGTEISLIATDDKKA